MSPDLRRAFRTGLHGFGALVMLGALLWILPRLTPQGLLLVAMGFIAILFVREVFHGAENVTARIKIGASTTGVNAEVDPK